MVIDSGLTASSGERIKAMVRNPNHAIMITTYLDTDHIGNALPILDAGMGHWDAVFTSTFPGSSVRVELAGVWCPSRTASPTAETATRGMRKWR